MTSKYFDPHTSFLHLPIVKVTAFSLVAASLFWGGVIVVNSKVDWELSYIGFNHFLVVFRFPLGILAMIIPVIALLAANHRSEQTKEQIRVTNNQNIFSNYYKHVEEFSKYLKNEDNTNNGIVIEPRYSHEIVFPRAKDGDYSISKDVIKLSYDLMGIPITLLSFHPKSLGNSMGDSKIELCTKIIRDSMMVIHKRGCKYNVKDSPHAVEYSDSYLLKSKVIINDAFHTLKNIIHLCEFSPEYRCAVNFIIHYEDLVSEINREVYILEGDDALMSASDERSFECACDIFKEIKEDFLTKTKGMLRSYHDDYIQHI